MIGDKIKALRKSKGLNQTDFARPLFVTAGAVSQWEKGVTWPDTERLMTMSKVYGVPLDYFNDEATPTETPTEEPPKLNEFILEYLKAYPEKEQLVLEFLQLSEAQVQSVKDYVAFLRSTSSDSSSDHK